MKVRNFKLGVVLAGFTLAAAPAMAQSPKAGGDAGSGARSNPSGASSGSAVERGSGGGGGGSAATSSGGGSTAGSSSTSTSSSSPSASAASSPSASFGRMREAAPSHRYSDGSSPRVSTASDGQRAAPRSSGSGGSNASGSSGSSNASGGSGARAVPRGSSASSGSSSSTPAHTASASSERNAGNANNVSGAREVPSLSRPRGDHPVTGTAVGRTVPVNGGDHGDYSHHGGYYGGGYYYDPFYNSYYGNFYPYYAPYGFGLGYGLYSGLGWNPYFGDPFGYSDPYGGSGSYSSSQYYQDQGHMKLKVKPRDAKVYVDGYFVGPVDSFDGAFQKLPLNAGRHKVEIKADGYETADFDVVITPNQTVTFQGELKRIQ